MKIELNTLGGSVAQASGKRIFPDNVDVVLFVYDENGGHIVTPLDKKAVKEDDHYSVEIPSGLLDRIEGGWVNTAGLFEHVSNTEILLESIRINFPWPRG